MATDGHTGIPAAAETPKRKAAAGKARPKPHKEKPREAGKLRIGDDWNAIRIIALSQSNPLKAIAEFVRTASMRARARSPS